ncbi:hypothetical protein O3S80_45425 [Streptomyces sp. Lzd4kr]|nr:hypothetical protein [Streptomyces sp. Lzd4kr]
MPEVVKDKVPEAAKGQMPVAEVVKGQVPAPAAQQRPVRWAWR